MAFEHTFQKGKDQVTKKLSPIRAIVEKCYQCKNNRNLVKSCEDNLCALYPFRFGKSGPKKEISEKQKAVLRERLQKMRNEKDKGKTKTTKKKK